MEKDKISIPVKEGEFFATIIGPYDDSSNRLVNLKINEIYRKLTTNTITFKEDYFTRLYRESKQSDILFIFKYIGDNKAIELVTNQIFSIQFSEDLEKSTCESIFNDYKLSKDNNKKSRTDFSLVIAGSEINFIKPTEQLKLEYWNNIFGNEEKKQVLQDTFKEYTANFDKNYERIIRNEIYTIATVENAMYDLDRRTNQKVKQKTLQ